MPPTFTQRLILVAAALLLAAGVVELARGQDPAWFPDLIRPPPGLPAADLAGPLPPEQSARLSALEQEVELLRQAVLGPDIDDPQPTLWIAGLLHIDYLWFGQDAASRAAVGDVEDGSDIRRARLSASGEAFDVVEYAIGFDFALAGRPTFLDVWVGVQDLPHLGTFRVGHFFEPFSLERVTLVRYTTFMERSLADTFAPARNLGMMVRNNYGPDQNGVWAVGWFRHLSDDFGDDVGDDGEQAVTGRLTWLPFYDDTDDGRSYLHLGAGYSFREGDEGGFSFRTTPEARMSAMSEGTVPFFVDTGFIPAEHLQLFGAELLWVRGPLSFQAEYMHVPVRQIGGPDLRFQAAYAYVSYFLTGEHRPYDKNVGVLDRVQPFESFFRVRAGDGVATGRGAWEVAARASWIDLDSANIQGGILYDTTLALNWYLNPHTRISWEYIRADLTSAGFGHTTTHIAGMRFGIDF